MLHKLITIILGYLMGYLTYLHLIKKNIYHGPNSKIIQQNIYKSDDGNYYKFIPQVCICPL